MRYKIVFIPLLCAILSLIEVANSQQKRDNEHPKFQYTSGRRDDIEGVNFNLTKEGYPYIICDYFQVDNHQHSHNGEVLEGGRQIKCFKDHTKDERLGCFAVFDYKNETIKGNSSDNSSVVSLVLRTQGCWTPATDGIEHCVLDDLCVHNDPLIPTPMFCCCTQHNCNNDVYMAYMLPNRTDMRVLNPDSTNNDIEELNEENQIPEEHQRPDLIWIVCGIIICMIVIVSFVSIGIHLKWKRKKKRVCDGEAHTEVLPLVEVKPKPMCSHEEESVFNVSDMSYIGKGRFGAVSAGTWTKEDGTTVPIAVKSFSKMDKESFNHEIGIYVLPTMKDCRCSHILRYLGWRNGINGDLWLITEYYSMGNLKEYLEKNILSIDQSLRIMVTALEGLSYLHDERMIMGSHKPAIAHRDIKSKNILLKLENGTVQSVIGDFGLAMKLDGSLTTVSHGQVGTRRYMAPEVLEGAQQFTASAFRQVDVYAMGLVIWELLLRTRIDSDDVVSPYQAPYEAEVPGNPSLFDMSKAVVKGKIRPLFREEIKNHPDLGQVSTSCEEMWHQEAEGRVTAGCAMERIKKILGEESEGYHSGTSLSKDTPLHNGNIQNTHESVPEDPELPENSNQGETIPFDPSQS